MGGWGGVGRLEISKVDEETAQHTIICMEYVEAISKKIEQAKWVHLSYNLNLVKRTCRLR